MRIKSETLPCGVGVSRTVVIMEAKRRILAVIPNVVIRREHRIGHRIVVVRQNEVVFRGANVVLERRPSTALGVSLVARESYIRIRSLVCAVA